MTHQCDLYNKFSRSKWCSWGVMLYACMVSIAAEARLCNTHHPIPLHARSPSSWPATIFRKRGAMLIQLYYGAHLCIFSRQTLKERVVLFNSRHVRTALQQVLGQVSGPRADLQDGVAGLDPCRRDNVAQDGVVSQKVLPQ